jgi:hypothetical protein
MAARSSSNSGLWSASSTWGGAAPPGDGDTAAINANHIVEIDGSITVGTSPADNTTYVILINTGGTLKWLDNPTGNWTLTLKGNVRVAQGATFQIGSEGIPIPSTRTATISFIVAGGATTGYRIWNNGTLLINGAPNYHMAATALQRAKLIGNITAGVGATFQTDAAVDWSVGDVVWVGVGADPTSSPTTCEQVAILTKTNASQYTATFLYNHRIGDFLVHGTRNVLIQGTSGTQPFYIINSAFSTANTGADIVCNIRWARLYFGSYSTAKEYAVVCFDCYTSASTTKRDFKIPVGNLIINNTVFDTPAGTTRCAGIFLYGDLGFTDTSEFIDEVHFWGFAKSVNISGMGAINLGHISVIHAYSTFGNTGITAAVGPTVGSYLYWANVAVSSFWYSGDSGWAGAAIKGNVFTITNFEIYRAGYAIQMVNSTTDLWIKNIDGLKIATGKIYWSNTVGVTLENTNNALYAYIKDVAFYSCYLVGLGIDEIVGDIFVQNCSFDRCNYENSSTTNCGVMLGLSLNLASVTFDHCTFGTVSRNYRRNANAMQSGTYSSIAGREIFQDCTFVEPISWAYNYGYIRNAMWWAISPGSWNRWEYRMQCSIRTTMELINPKVYRAVDNVDIWPIDYPNVTRLALVAGGGEVRNETSVIVDGSYALKILPFHTVFNCHATKMRPLKYTLQQGKTLTVSLQFRKTADGDWSELPGLHLQYPGGYTEAFATAGLYNTWETVTVSAMAEYDGIAECWVLGGTNQHGASSHNPEAGAGLYGPPPGSLTTDSMFAATVYVDGLTVTRL